MKTNFMNGVKNGVTSLCLTLIFLKIKISFSHKNPIDIKQFRVFDSITLIDQLA